MEENPEHSFALFLPENAGTAKKVLIFFDPHGDGSYPLSLYQNLASEYNCILMGSNDSRNGLMMQETQDIATELIDEALFRFKAEEVVLCGFSGGAKVALYIGSSNPQVQKIVYCGAAGPLNPRPSLQLLGFVGKRDMNYSSVVQFEWELKNTPMEHYLVEWKGEHRFPPAEVFRDAFEFAVNGRIPNYSAKQVSTSRADILAEEQYKNKLVKAFETKDLDWWQGEIARLEADTSTNVMHERLLGFISLACYSLGNRHLEQNQLAAAEKIIAIYRLADPDNEAHEEFAARLDKKRQG